MTKILAEIKVFSDDPDKILKVFEPEVSSKDRSFFDIVVEKDCIRFIINAEDSVALRATTNSITKLLTVYEKLNGLVNDGKRDE